MMGKIDGGPPGRQLIGPTSLPIDRVVPVVRLFDRGGGDREGMPFGRIVEVYEW